MRQVIHDKEIRVCICGKSNKTVVRTAKQRVSTWMGTVVVIMVILLVVSEDGYKYSGIEVRDLLPIGVALFIVLATAIKTVSYLRKGHSLMCALRWAYYMVS